MSMDRSETINVVLDLSIDNSGPAYDLFAGKKVQRIIGVSRDSRTSISVCMLNSDQ